MTWLKKLTTGKDNETPDWGRLAWIGSFFTVVGHSVYSVYHGVSVSLIDLATALTAVSVGHGVALGVKKDTEPAPSEEEK